MSGWIKVSRSIRNSHWWTAKPFGKGQALIDLMLRASYTDVKFSHGNQLIDCPKGSFVTSMVKLAEDWGWNRKTVITFLEHLKADNTIDYKTDNKKTHIFIMRYDSCPTNYLDQGTAEWTADGAAEGQQSGQQKDTIKKVKNSKKGRINTPLPPAGESAPSPSELPAKPKQKPPEPDVFEEFRHLEEARGHWQRWLDHRRQLKKPLTIQSQKAQLMKWVDPKRLMACIDLSIERNWLGLKLEWLENEEAKLRNGNLPTHTRPPRLSQNVVNQQRSIDAVKRILEEDDDGPEGNGEVFVDGVSVLPATHANRGSD